MIQVTDAAKSYLNGVIGKEGNKYLRMILSAGWGGPQYQMALDESISTNDVEEKSGDFSLIYSKNLAQYMEGVKIDYVKTMFGPRLTIDSPLSSQC